MGMFDSVLACCPKCETPVEFQSKSGDCTLTTYTLEDAPDDVLRGIHGDCEICPQCGQALTAVVEGYVPKRTLSARIVPKT